MGIMSLDGYTKCKAVKRKGERERKKNEGKKV